MSNHWSLDIGVGENVATLELKGSVYVGTAREIRDRLVKEVESGRDIVLRLTDVGRFDAAGVQLVLALESHVSREGRRLSIVADGLAARVLKTSGAIGHLDVRNAADAPHDDSTVERNENRS